MGLIRSEKGFTLLEMLIVVGILGVIMGVMTMSVAMIMKVSPQNNDWTIALRRVQNAGYWISRDVQMAQTIDPNPTAPNFLILTLPVMDIDTQTIINKTFIYKLEDMNGGMKKLTRTDQDTGQQITIAEYIYYAPDTDPQNSTMVINYDAQSRVLTVRITASSGTKRASRNYEAAQRVPAAS